MLRPRSAPFLTVGKTTVKVKRSTGGQRVSGVWKENPPIIIEATGSIQPFLKSTELLLLPEGDRTKETIKFYTATEIRAGKEGVNARSPDIILWNDAEWEVKKAVPYQMGVLNHYEVVAVRQELS